MNILGVRVDHKSHRMFLSRMSIALIMMTLLASLGAPVAFYFNDSDYMDVMVPTFAYVQHYVTLFILQFFFVCLGLRERFKLLNVTLR